MRDVALMVFFFGVLPFAFTRPYVGIYIWTWLAMMNPHRQTWGFAYDFPFAQVTAIVTLVALLASREQKRVPWTRESVVLLIFNAWMLLTTLLALYPALAWEQWDKVWKIQLFVFLTMVVINTKQRLDWLVWVIALSLGFYGVKGGIFTIGTAGAHRVQGPTGSFIGGNNEIAVALIMTIPLLRYLQLQMSEKWAKLGLSAAMWLTGIAIIGTQSRGALVGAIPMAGFFLMKSRNKAFILLAVAAVTWGVIAIMPQEWYDRMATIQTYEEDKSAMGRVNAWWAAFNLAKDRLTGGGFETFQQDVFARYAPNPSDYRDVHSIYFEVIGEQGFIGFGLFMLLAWFTWSTGNAVKRRAKASQDTRWAADLASMVQVSMIGYAAAGAFLGMAYFDLYYTLIAVMVICRVLLDRQLAAVTLTHRRADTVAETGTPGGSRLKSGATVRSTSVRQVGASGLPVERQPS